MQILTASIINGSTLLASNIRAWITQHHTNDLIVWKGRFELEQLPEILANSEGPYDIKLSDGRSGKFIVSLIDMHTSPIVVNFEGSGPLKTNT